MINFDAPLNETSLGQTSFNIFSELSKNTDIALFPFGNQINLSVFSLSDDDSRRINQSIENSLNFDKKNPVFHLWHIKDSEKSIKGSSYNLFTFHETNTLTGYEVNRLSQNDIVFVSSKYTQEVFEFYLPSTVKVIYCPLGFDKRSFHRIENESDIIRFGLRGKLEKRKHTIKIIKNWITAFGGDPRYRLDLSIHNFFLGEDARSLVVKELSDKTIPWNVNFLPFLGTNKLFNEALNNVDIDLTGLSGCEGFNLPCFQSLCLGKQVVALNAHVHKDYCNSENAILIDPRGMIEANDNKFFIKGSPVNQGKWFDFNDDDCISAMKLAAQQAKNINHAGMKLQDWSYDKSAKIISDAILSI